MPAEQELVVASVGFFEDDCPGSAVVIVAKAEVYEVGGVALGIIGAVGTDCVWGDGADAASAEEFNSEGF